MDCGWLKLIAVDLGNPYFNLGKSLLLKPEFWLIAVEICFLSFRHLIVMRRCFFHLNWCQKKGDLFSWCDADPGPGRAREDAGLKEAKRCVFSDLGEGIDSQLNFCVLPSGKHTKSY